MGLKLPSIPWWWNLEWRNRKRTMLTLCAIEFPPTVAALTLFGIADPNTYRTKMWAEGALHGWNSDPIEILYAYANYKPIPVPTPWNQMVTDWNVVISVLSMFILLTKTTMYLTHVFPPLFSAIVHGALTVVWAYAIALQAASDYSDATASSRVPWYLTHGCGDPVAPANQGYCMQAKGSFAVTVVMFFLFFTFFIFSVLSAIPSAEQKRAFEIAEAERREWDSLVNFDDKKWEYELDQMHLPPQTPGFQHYPATPGFAPSMRSGVVPKSAGMQSLNGAVMPRETFSTLEGTINGLPAGARRNGDLPLRHHITSDFYAS